MQSVLKEQQEDEKKEKRQIIYPSEGTNWNIGDGNTQGVVEGFAEGAGCGCGVPPAWLLIILFIVIVLIVIVMMKL
jgi:hypothetical protein